MVHELEPKKWVFSPGGWTKFLVTSGSLLSWKVCWAAQIGSFWPKLRYSTDQNGPKGGPHKNEFWVFLNSEMNVTNGAQKVDEKNEVICIVSMFPSWFSNLSDAYYINCFNRLRFLAKVSKKSQKVHFFGQFKDCVHYIFTSLFCMSKREDLWNKEKCFY